MVADVQMTGHCQGRVRLPFQRVPPSSLVNRLVNGVSAGKNLIGPVTKRKIEIQIRDDSANSSESL